MEDEYAYPFCMFGVVKTGEAFEVVLVVKARWGEGGGGMGPGPYILVTFRDTSSLRVRHLSEFSLHLVPRYTCEHISVPAYAHSQRISFEGV